MLSFTEKGEMKNNRFENDNKEFNFGYVKLEIIQTYPTGIVSRELGIWMDEFHLLSMHSRKN